MLPNTDQRREKLYDKKNFLTSKRPKRPKKKSMVIMMIKVIKKFKTSVITKEIIGMQHIASVSRTQSTKRTFCCIT